MQHLPPGNLLPTAFQTVCDASGGSGSRRGLPCARARARPRPPRTPPGRSRGMPGAPSARCWRAAWRPSRHRERPRTAPRPLHATGERSAPAQVRAARRSGDVPALWGLWRRRPARCPAGERVVWSCSEPQERRGHLRAEQPGPIDVKGDALSVGQREQEALAGDRVSTISVNCTLKLTCPKCTSRRDVRYSEPPYPNARRYPVCVGSHEYASRVQTRQASGARR